MGYRALLAVSCRVCPVTGLLAAGGEPLGSATKICLVYNSVDDCVFLLQVVNRWVLLQKYA